MTQNTSQAAVRLTVAEARDLGCQALEALGLTPAEAKVTTDHLVENALAGYTFAGLPRILAIADSRFIREPRQPITVVHETSVSARLDGGNHLGYVVLHRCVEIALEKARAHGMAVVGAANCWFSGRNAYYLDPIARAGYVGIHTAGGAPAVVPPGARRPFLGTNPIAIAIPRKPDPLVFDMGTASAMWGEVLLKSYLREPFPDGIGVDEDGNPTNDASAIVKGGVLPFGGYKGYGLSVMIQAMALLAGAQSPRNSVADRGFLFVVFDPGLLGPPDAFAAELERMIADMKALPRKQGVDDIRLPSERAYRERQERNASGFIEIGRSVYDRLVKLRSDR